MTSAARREPGTIAAVVVLGQALTLLVLGLWAVVEGIAGHVDDRVAAELMAALALLTGIALALAGRGLFFARRWARAPVLVWELIMLPVGVSLARAIPAAGAVVLASAAAVLAAMFAGRPAAG
jgi:hypothetical protein